MNNRKILWGVIENKVLGRRKPLRAIFKVTKRCNLQCKHCCEWKFFKKDDLPLYKIRYMFDKLARAGTTHLSLNGGEPLLRDDIGEIIKYAKKLKMSVGVTTNGSFVPAKINEIKDVDFLGLSLDGPREMHDFLRGEGQFEQIMKAIDIAKENKIRGVYINTVLTKELCSDLTKLEEVVNIAKERGIRCNFVTMYGDVREGSVIKKPSDEELRNALVKIIELKRGKAPIMFAEFTYNYIINWPDLSKEKYFEGEEVTIKNPIKCKAVDLAIAIEANGDIFPCNMTKGEVKPVNIFSPESVPELLKELSKRNKCKYCYYACYCEINALLSLKPKMVSEYLTEKIKND